MSRRAVYTGSFDPITLGHLNVIERSSRLVDELIVGVGLNIEKRPLFTADERSELIYRVTPHLSNVIVKTFTGLAVRFVRECGARVIIRGVRKMHPHPATTAPPPTAFGGPLHRCSRGD